MGIGQQIPLNEIIEMSDKLLCNGVNGLKFKNKKFYFKSPIIVLSMQVSEIRANDDYDSVFR